MTSFHFKHCLGLLIGMLLMTAGCQKNIVVLLPDPDGVVGRISVANAAGVVEMDAAHTSTAIRDAETAPSVPAVMAPKDIENLFGDVLAHQPEQPLHFILYFDHDSTRLKSASLEVLPEIVKTIQTRRSDHISVVGHSDALGDKDYNLQLSRRRAEAVKTLLEEKGVPAASIETTSHGEENPLVKTDDTIGNPKNRRVEVVVR